MLGGWSQITLDDSGNIYAAGNLWTGDYSVQVTKFWGIQPIPLSAQRNDEKLVLTWDNPTFQLQTAPVVSGDFTNIVGAFSPYTNSISQSNLFFRLQLSH